MFFTYRQNNSGGYFYGNLLVIVEADSYKEADRIAEADGEVYFNGCTRGHDCPCCGDRWYSSFYSEGDEVPSNKWGEPIELDADGYPKPTPIYDGSSKLHPVKIIYKDGVKETPK